MSSQRDDLFPSGSIGRSQGLFIQRTPSPAPSLTKERETLTAHPLLSPNPSSSAPVSTAPTMDTQDATTLGMRYVTYTPRHRSPFPITMASLKFQATFPMVYPPTPSPPETFPSSKKRQRRRLGYSMSNNLPQAPHVKRTSSHCHLERLAHLQNACLRLGCHPHFPNGAKPSLADRSQETAYTTC